MLVERYFGTFKPSRWFFQGNPNFINFPKAIPIFINFPKAIPIFINFPEKYKNMTLEVSFLWWWSRYPLILTKTRTGCLLGEQWMNVQFYFTGLTPRPFEPKRIRTVHTLRKTIYSVIFWVVLQHMAVVTFNQFLLVYQAKWVTEPFPWNSTYSFNTL